MAFRRTFWIGLVVVLGLLTLAACGGSKEEPIPTPTAIPIQSTRVMEKAQVAEEAPTEAPQTGAASDAAGQEEATADAEISSNSEANGKADDGHAEDAADHAPDESAGDEAMNGADDHAADEATGGDHEATDDHGISGEHQDDEATPVHPHVEVPDEYAHMENPGVGDEAIAAAGQALFEANCASCHGPAGAGDGPAAPALDPPPANLADAAMMSSLSDAYLFWRISEGGAMEPFNSAMPPWKFLTEEQRWQLVNYIRTFTETP